MTRARDLAAFVSNADGDIKFDTDTLFIDSSANHVGISDTTPENKLTVVEDGTNVSVVKARTSASDGRVSYQIGNDADNWFMGIDGGNSDSFFISDVVSSSDRLVIDTSGNVGIGTNSPASILHVKGRTLAVDGAAASDSPRLNLDLDGTNKASVLLNRTTENLQVTVAGDNLITFTANSSEKVRIDDDGLKFNGDSAAVNALDDYEEGTFTPAASPALSTSSGVYRKIGKLVHVGMKFTNAASSSAGSVTITGLPFTNVNDNAARAGLVVSWNSNGAGAGLQFLMGLNATTGVFYLDGSVRTLANMSEKTVYIGGTYPVA